jgi:hypothetical protein
MEARQAKQRSGWWGLADLVVCVPAALVLLIVLIRYEAHQSRTEAENLGSLGILAALLLTAYSTTLFLRGRRLFGLLSRRGTIVAGIGLILTALVSGVAALAMDVAAHL